MNTYAFLWKCLATKDRTSWKAKLIRDLYRHLYSSDQMADAK